MYEYVALKCSTSVWSHDRGFASAYCRLREQGWEEHLRAHFEKYDGGACIMRRPKDEPRMWTEAEVRKIAALVMDCRVPVLNERAMQADLCGRLERRNAELQETMNDQQQRIAVLNSAIRKVMYVAHNPKTGEGCLPHYEAIKLVIREHLCLLMPPMPREEAWDDECERLKRRNTELQEAIDTVVSGVRLSGIQDHEYVSRWVSKYLYPLATKATVAYGSNWTIKEESNG